MLTTIASLMFITTDPKTKRFLLENGSEIVFHGHNVVSKVPPYMPNLTGPWDYEFSFVDADINFFKNNGFNMVRLGVMWPGVYPQKDKVDKNYLEKLEKFINKLGENGIYTQIDFHQDLMSAYFCGEGIPDWAIPFERAGQRKFALPIYDEHQRDPVTHHPSREKCLSKLFSTYYAADLVGNVNECLYDENCNPFDNNSATYKYSLQQEFVKYWATIAQHFKNNQFVIGYDLINEPTAGSVSQNFKNYAFSKRFERDVMTKFYQNIMEAIWAVDKNHLIFFEPVVTGFQFTGFPVGGPGVAIKIPADKQVFTWHIYCLSMDRNADPVSRLLCRLQDRFFYHQKNTSGSQLGLAQFIDEFGALPDNDVSNGLLREQLELMSNDSHSWAYWQYKPFGDITTVFNSQSERNEGLYNKDGSIQFSKSKNLAHPYLQIINGLVKTSQFHFRNGSLVIKLRTGLVSEDSVVVIPQLWEGFGKVHHVSGPVKVGVHKKEILISNTEEGKDAIVVLY